ncbi:MAG: 2,3-bisphosphoglycerate-independent phosphoglycerate mutase [Nannocystaceae bacterium]
MESALRLAPNPARKAPDGPLVVVVMDGVGLGHGDFTDAVARAYTPTLDGLRALPSATSVLAHGVAVGLPSDGDMGNSEVGHNALGAGRVVDQGAKLVARALASGALFEGAVWLASIAQVKRSGEPLHLLGLLSDGGVHSHIDHLLALLRRAASEGVAALRVHVLLDGRDVPGRSALGYLETLEAALAELRASGCDARIASGGGRMFVTMDRYEADWGMVARGWALHVHGDGRRFASAEQAVRTLYAETGGDDQFLPGFVIADDDGPVGPVRDGAAVILFNFRGDRAIEISRAFDEGDTFTAFDRGRRPDVLYAGMMQYDGDLLVPRRFLVEPPAIDRTMGELLAAAGRRQLAISETHKYGHVTYFWNGNRSGCFDPALETYVEIPSAPGPIEARPWMEAAAITDRVVQAIAAGVRDPAQRYDLIRLNYANGDMVGHTGDLRATILAVETVDLCLARLAAATRRAGGVLLVTADHGNADQMLDLRGDGSYLPRTSHSLNRVPLTILDPRAPGGGPTIAGIERAGLGNVAATCLDLLGFAAPEGYLPSLLAPAK